MSPPTTLLDRVRLRLRSRRVIEAERDAAVANAQGWQRSAKRWCDELDQVGAVLCEHGYHAHEGWGVLASDVRDALRMVRAQHGRDVDRVAAALGILTGPGIPVDVDSLVEVVAAVRRRARAATDVAGELDRELTAVRDVLRATAHGYRDVRGLSYDVDIAIDTERERGQDLVERLAEVLGWRSHSSWPCAAPHLVRAIAMRLGQPMPRRSSARAWPPGSSMARALACTCRGDRGQGPTSIVDPQCPEHSPGRRFGRPVQPLALPPAPTTEQLRERLVGRFGADAMDRADALIESTLTDLAAGRVCGADLDGATCVLPLEHDEPCWSGMLSASLWANAVMAPIARCEAAGFLPDPGRCVLVAGHPGDHSWSVIV